MKPLVAFVLLLIVSIVTYYIFTKLKLVCFITADTPLTNNVPIWLDFLMLGLFLSAAIIRIVSIARKIF